MIFVTWMSVAFAIQTENRIFLIFCSRGSALELCIVLGQKAVYPRRMMHCKRHIIHWRWLFTVHEDTHGAMEIETFACVLKHPQRQRLFLHTTRCAVLYDWAINVPSLLYCSTRVCLLHFFVGQPSRQSTEYLGGLFSPIVFWTSYLATNAGVWI